MAIKHFPLGSHRVLTLKLGRWTELRVKVPREAERELAELIGRWKPATSPSPARG